jgi:hypothetical protein
MIAGRAAFLAALRAQTADPPDPVAVCGAAPTPWLWDIATALYDLLPANAADGWAVQLLTLLTEHPPPQELLVVHRWQAQTVLPLVSRTSRPQETDAVTELAGLHTLAAQGTTTGQNAWRTALTPVLLHLHHAAYDRTNAYVQSHVGARDFALSNGFSAADADSYGHEYARLSSNSNAHMFAESHARALSVALALAYSTGDCIAYADTWPRTQVRVVVKALADGTGTGDAAPSVTCLARGLLTALWPTDVAIEQPERAPTDLFVGEATPVTWTL